MNDTGDPRRGLVTHADRHDAAPGMETFVRVLSSGRTGTNFLAESFLDQGFLASHETLPYDPEPERVHRIPIDLATQWYDDPEGYFAARSGFADYFIRSARRALDIGAIPRIDGSDPRTPMSRLRDLLRPRRTVLIDCNNFLTPATPVIDRAAVLAGLQTKYLVLIRNGFKTIHSIYLIERESDYQLRSPRFSAGDRSELGAAGVWANTYRMIHDQMNRIGKEKFLVVRLEDFASNAALAAGVFGFLGLSFSARNFETFRNRIAREPLRKNKYPSIRNSHHYQAPEFVIADRRLAEIADKIEGVARLYGIDLDRALHEYRYFHEVEKGRLGFA